MQTGRTRGAGGGAVGIALALVLLACSEPAPTSADDQDDRLQVVASMSVIADFAAQVGGEHAAVTSLVPVGGDPHVHEPTPSDARAVGEADLLLGNGVGLEPWFDDLVEAGGREVVSVTDALDGHVVDDGMGEPDPHLWMVPPLAAVYVRRIAAELTALDPDRREVYAANAATYIEELDHLDTEIRERLAPIPEQRRLLVTSHDAYGYFAEHYDLDVATVVGVSTDEEPSAARVQQLVDRVRRSDVPTVFVETTVNPAVIRRIADDAGVEVGDELYGDSVGAPGTPEQDYLGMMRANARALAEGLGP